MADRDNGIAGIANRHDQRSRIDSKLWDVVLRHMSGNHESDDRNDHIDSIIDWDNHLKKYLITIMAIGSTENVVVN